MSDALEVDDLHVRFGTRADPVHAVSGVSFEIAPGEIVGLAGESGCGKSVTARSIVRLEEPGEIAAGSVRYGGRDLTTADDRTLQRLRAREVAMVHQNRSTTLNPVYTVGEQIAEAVRVRRDPDRQSVLAELVDGSSRRRSQRTRSTVLELMETVGITRAEERIDDYPHQFSGGMRQRVLLAIALVRRPSLLIADEPTTALDTTTKAAILDVLVERNETRGMGVLLISHDFGVLSAICDRIVVMYDGVVVERGPTDELRSNPAHPYTKVLLDSLPHRSEPRTRLPTVGGTPPDGSAPPTGCAFADRCPYSTDDCRNTVQPTVSVADEHTVTCGVPDARIASLETKRADATPSPNESAMGAVPAVIGATTGASVTSSSRSDDRSTDASERPPAAASPVELESVTKSFRKSDRLFDRLLGRDDRVTAVDGVSLELRAGETAGLVGESGCGKTTLARLIAGLETPTDGVIRLSGRRVGGAGSRTSEQLAEIGYVFQNADASLDPKRTVGASIAEPLVEAGWAASRRDERVETLLSLVGLPLAYRDRYPTQLSGGERHRVAIARALALEPSVLVLDEPTASLDVSTQARILNLLADLRAELGVTILFVSHDLDVVRHVADRVAVMYRGRIVEIGPASETVSNPTHPYTETLLKSIPGERPSVVSDAI